MEAPSETASQIEDEADVVIARICAERRARLAASTATDRSAIRAASGVPIVRTEPAAPAPAPPESGTGWFTFDEPTAEPPMRAAAVPEAQSRAASARPPDP